MERGRFTTGRLEPKVLHGQNFRASFERRVTRRETSRRVDGPAVIASGGMGRQSIEYMKRRAFHDQRDER